MKPPKRLAADELFTFAVKKLSGRSASMGEIRASLQPRAMQPADVESVLARLKEYGYLNDQRFAESFASGRLENEGLGQFRVLRDLRRRRVAPELAQTTVARLYAGKEEDQLIEQYLRRKYREPSFQDDKELAAALRRLIRAGFKPANALRVLKKFAAHPELLDEVDPEATDDE